MRSRGLLLMLLLCGIILLAPACTTRTSGTPTSEPGPMVPVGPPTPIPQPTSAAPPSTQPPQNTVAPPPELTEWPQMTVLGTLEGGIPHGVTDTGHYFKGNPDAKVVILEFSEYQ